MCNSPIVKYGRILDCKQCLECQKIESWRWTQRIKVETFMAKKTWFCTFTYRGAKEVGYSDIQKMFKRLRKKFEFRYLVVSETGEQNGRLHYHAMIHGDLTRREVESEWKHGFSNAKLGDNAVRYISKYISKAKSEIGGKCYRASIGYGTRDLNKRLSENEIVKQIMDRFPRFRVVKVNDIKIPYKQQMHHDTDEKNKIIKINALRRDGT